MRREPEPAGKLFRPHTQPGAPVDPATFQSAKKADDAAPPTPEERRLGRAARRRARADERAAAKAEVSVQPSDAPAEPEPDETEHPGPTRTPPDRQKPGVRYIDGWEVVADEDAPTGHYDRDDLPTHQRAVRELLLINGDTVYGCAYCPHTSGDAAEIKPHLRTHSAIKRSAARPAPKEPVVAASESGPPAVVEPAPPADDRPLRLVPSGAVASPALLSQVPTPIANLTLSELADRVIASTEADARIADLQRQLADAVEGRRAAERAAAAAERRATAAEDKGRRVEAALAAAGFKLAQ